MKIIEQPTEAILQWVNDFVDRGIFTTDQQLNILSWNHWLEIHSGLSQTEVIGKNLLEVYPQLIQRRFEGFYHQALSGQVIILAQRLHGYLLPMSLRMGNNVSTQMLQSGRIGPLRENHQIIGTITVIEDVTERVARELELQHQVEALQQTELALLSTHAQLQHLLSSSPAVIYTRKLSAGEPLTFVSNNITTKLGYFPQDFIKNSNFWFEHLHPEDRAEILAIAPDLFYCGHQTLEYRFRHQDGTYRWIRDERKLVKTLAGDVYEIVGAWYDMTERREAEAKVREQAALLDIATDAIFVKDLDDKILFWNQSAEQLYGWSAAEVYQQKAHEILFTETSEQLTEAFNSIFATGEWRGELHQITKTGEKLIVASRWTLVYDERQKPKSILAVNTDITQQKALEAQLMRSQRMESIGTLTGGIAHDLNNLLTPILMASELLQMDIPPAKQPALLQLIHSSALRGTNLLKQLLSFARGVNCDYQSLNLQDFLAENASFLQEILSKTIQVKTKIATDIWPIYADATQLNQVLVNIGVNARDAMPQGGTLQIAAENVEINETMARMNLELKPGAYVRMTISDTGKGISPEIVDRIFEPFFTTKDVGKGTGLGLSTVLGIIKSHKGFVTVSSEIGQGTSFHVYLPIAKEAQVLTKVC